MVSRDGQVVTYQIVAAENGGTTTGPFQVGSLVSVSYAKQGPGSLKIGNQYQVSAWGPPDQLSSSIHSADGCPPGTVAIDGSQLPENFTYFGLGLPGLIGVVTATALLVACIVVLRRRHRRRAQLPSDGAESAPLSEED